MRFATMPRDSPLPAIVSDNQAFLIEDNWDDFGFKTQFYLVVVLKNKQRINVGNVKIGRASMPKGRLDLPRQFEKLERQYFSLGQDEVYYENLMNLDRKIRYEIFTNLRDIVYNERLLLNIEREEVAAASILRDVAVTTVAGKFRRIVEGKPKLTAFACRFTLFNQGSAAGPSLNFNVVPNSSPPTNAHAIIGRNGSGKTRLLNGMVTSIVDVENLGDRIGNFVVGTDGKAETSEQFAGVVSVSFSAFDKFSPLSEDLSSVRATKYSYVGLKKLTESSTALKSRWEMSAEFSASLRRCFRGARLERWIRAMATLESDSSLSELAFSSLGQDVRKGNDALALTKAHFLYDDLSSGHALVLLTMTKLVEIVQERSLVLIDEPETHLHPPLLSALIRSICDLLEDQNAVAIIATHSPVVLQELPSSCVSRIERSGDEVVISRPTWQTFAENVGSLTRDVFGLELMRSGFYNLLKTKFEELGSIDAVISDLGGQIGGEGLALLRSLALPKWGEAGEPK